MAKERALTLEALRVMDAIDRRGSFAAAADELGCVPSALSYTMQKTWKKSWMWCWVPHPARAIAPNSPMSGGCCWSAGRVLLEAADKLTTDAEALARGWETHLTIVTEALVPTPALFPVNRQTGGKSQYPTGNHHRSAGGGVGTTGAGAGGYCYRAGYAFSFLVGDQTRASSIR